MKPKRKSKDRTKYRVVFHMEVPIDEKDIKNKEKIFGAISDEYSKYIYLQKMVKI